MSEGESANWLHLDFIVLHPYLFFLAKRQRMLETVIAPLDFSKL